MQSPMGYVPGPPKKGISVLAIVIFAVVGSGVLGVLAFVALIVVYAMGHNPPHSPDNASASADLDADTTAQSPNASTP